MTPEREFSRHTAGIMLELLQEPCRKWFLTGCSGTVPVNDIVPSSCTSSPQCLVQLLNLTMGRRCTAEMCRFLSKIRHALHLAQVGLFETVLTAVLLARAARMCS